MSSTKKIGNLCITMTPGRQVFIGDDIVITVKKIQGEKQVRLLIQAPQDTKIVRDNAVELDSKNDTPEDK